MIQVSQSSRLVFAIILVAGIAFLFMPKSPQQPVEVSDLSAKKLTDANSSTKTLSLEAFKESFELMRSELPKDEYCEKVVQHMRGAGDFSRRTDDRRAQMTFLSRNWVRYCE